MRTPDWQSDDGAIQLYCCDCLELLPTIEAGEVDAVVTDPPYGVSLSYKSHDDSRKKYLELVPKWKAAIDSATDGPRLVSCGVANIAIWPTPRWIIAWLKPAAMGRCAVGFNNWEPVLVYGKTRGCSCDTFTAPIVPGEAPDGHPCPKPIRWATEQITRFTDGTVCDPFAGIGTTGVACVRTGRRFVGCEISREYFDIAVQRIKNELAQPRLFTAPVETHTQAEMFGASP